MAKTSQEQEIERWNKNQDKWAKRRERWNAWKRGEVPKKEVDKPKQ